MPYDLRESYKSIGPLYPVLVDRDGKVIDGFHRKAIDTQWPEVKLESVDTEEKRILLAIHANWHRREITDTERSRLLVALCKLHPEWKGHYSQKLSKLTGFTERWIRDLLPDKYTRPYRKRNSEVTSELDTDMHFLWNVWFADAQRPEGYGEAGFQGNTPPSLIKELLVRFTNPGDKILDSMAGSGTTIDIATELDRQVIATDICPLRPDIEEADAANLPFGDAEFDFIFNHFPYWKKAPYSKRDNELSHLPYEAFLAKSAQIFEESYRLLKVGKFYSVLIGDQRQERKIIDLSAKFSEIGQAWFSLYDKVIWISRTQRSVQHHAAPVSRAKKYNFYLQTFDTLLIFRKEDGQRKETGGGTRQSRRGGSSQTTPTVRLPCAQS